MHWTALESGTICIWDGREGPDRVQILDGPYFGHVGLAETVEAFYFVQSLTGDRRIRRAAAKELTAILHTDAPHSEHLPDKLPVRS